MLTSVTVDSRPESLSYSIVSNSNSSLVTASLTNERLNLSYAWVETGSTTITVRATDQFGATADTSFTVTVEPLSISSVTDPVNANNAADASVGGRDAADASNNISVTASAGGVTSAPVTTTVGSDGTSSVSEIVPVHSGRTITYTATLTNSASRTFSVTNASIPPWPDADDQHRPQPDHHQQRHRDVHLRHHHPRGNDFRRRYRRHEQHHGLTATRRPTTST